MKCFRKMQIAFTRIFLIVTTMMVGTTSIIYATGEIPYTFSPGETISSAQVNANFQALSAQIAALQAQLATAQVSTTSVAGIYDYFLFGTGMALVIAPLTKSALMVQPQFSGSASGVNNAVARFAALLAIAILGAVMLALFSGQLKDSISGANLTSIQQDQILSQSGNLGGIVVPADFSPAAHDSAHQIIRDSFMFAYRWAMLICAILAAVASAISALMIHNPPLRVQTTR